MQCQFAWPFSWSNILLYLFSQFHSIYCVMLSFFFFTWYIHWSKKRLLLSHQCNVIEKGVLWSECNRRALMCMIYDCKKIILFHKALEVLDFLGWNVIFCIEPIFSIVPTKCKKQCVLEFLIFLSLRKIKKSLNTTQGNGNH